MRLREVPAPTWSVGESDGFRGIGIGCDRWGQRQPGERTAVLLRDRPGGVAVRPRGRHEHGLAVVAQLLDALLDVGERTVVAALGGRLEVGAWIPAPGQLLDRGHI